MKKVLSIIIAIILCVSLCACNLSSKEPQATPTPEPTKEPTATPGPPEVYDPLVGTAILENLSQNGVIAFESLEKIEIAYISYKMATFNGSNASEFIAQGAQALNSYRSSFALLTAEEQTVLTQYFDRIVNENGMDLSIFETTPATNVPQADLAE